MTTLFRTVLSCEVLAVFVMAAVSLARLVLKKAPKRLTIFLWLIVCLRLLVPVRLEAPVSLVPEPASVLSSEVEHISETGELSSLSWSMEHPNVSSGTERAFTARQWGSLAFDLLPYLWVIGAAALFLAQLLKLYRLRKKLRDAVEISPGVYVSDKLSGAFVLGLFRPDIYLPEGLGEAQRRFVLLHERTHIKRLDHVWKLLAYFCLCLHWFDPLVWLCFALFCRDVELACDETVTAVLSGEERCDYAETLLRLSGQPPLFPLPAFSEPEPATRIKRVLSWKKPAKIVCAAVLVLAVVLGIGLLVNPYPKDAIFGQRYVVNKLLHAAPQFDYGFPKTVRSGDYPAFALSSDHHIYRSDRGTDFLACGYELEEVSVSYDQLLRLLLKDSGVAYSDATEALSRVRTCWVTQRMEDGYPFYLVMQAGEQVYLIVGYGKWGTEEAGVRWFFSLQRDELRSSYQELTAKIENTGTNPEENDIQIYGICMGEENPDLLAVAFEGVRNGHEMDGVAVFRDNGDLFGYTLLSIREDASGAPLLYETRYRQEFETPFTLITVHRDEIARVRASWNGVELSRLVVQCPSLVLLEWPKVFSRESSDSRPDVRFYDADGNEVPCD